MTPAAILITQGEVQLVAGILAVLLIAIVLFRRKGKKKSEDDEF
jgi:LPXTG-motif cell wall-anchored protein